jgi:AmmeMemoRadiSam system protein B
MLYITMPVEYPKLRPVEAFAVEGNVICLRDPEGFTDKIIMLKPEAFFICTLFDGTHSILDIQAEFTKQFGVLLISDTIHQIIRQLDQCLFLENERYFEARKNAIDAFRTNPLRSAMHAGTAYESDADKLKGQLDNFFIQKDGPGYPDTSDPTGRLVGLIAPHIDIRRGGLCFAKSYAELARECKAKIFLILGIAHSQTEKTFVLTEKDFETPFGTVRSEKRFISLLKQKCKEDFFQDEFVHKTEHSVEFQVLFLKYLFQHNNGIAIIPVLCSSMHRSIAKGISPYEEEEIKDFIDALRATLAEFDDDVCIIAGVDLSHIGQRFNQNITVTDTIIDQLEKNDKKLLAPVLEGDAENFMKLINEQQDRTNVCGIPAIYTLLKVIKPAESKLLLYDQAVDYTTNSIVSFAGAGFYR